MRKVQPSTGSCVSSRTRRHGSAPEPTEKVPGPRPTAPGYQRAHHQQADREQRARAEDEQVGEGRAHHQAHQPERRQPGEPLRQSLLKWGSSKKVDRHVLCLKVLFNAFITALAAEA
jgi:hypothetical protein